MSPTSTHRPRSYRGIPAAVDQAVSRMAADLNVPKGQVVRALLEYALDAYRVGELQLMPRSDGDRPTLYMGQVGTEDGD